MSLFGEYLIQLFFFFKLSLNKTLNKNITYFVQAMFIQSYLSEDIESEFYRVGFQSGHDHKDFHCTCNERFN